MAASSARVSGKWFFLAAVFKKVFVLFNFIYGFFGHFFVAI